MGFPVPDTGSVTEDDDVGGLLIATGDIDYFLPFFFPDTGDWTVETITGSYDSQLVIDEDGVWAYTAQNSNSAIQALNDGETLTEVFDVTSTGGPSTITITINGVTDPPCFTTGTLIETPAGARPVETLRTGDLVLTRDDGAQAIRWIGMSRIGVIVGSPFAAKLCPILIRAGALGPGVPQSDLMVSPQHRILVEGPNVSLLFGETEMLCPVHHLVDGRDIVQVETNIVVYYHMLFDRHQVVISNGCATESFFPGRLGLQGFSNVTREALFSAFPDLRSTPESYGRTARSVLRGYEADLLEPRKRAGETDAVSRPLFEPAGISNYGLGKASRFY